MDEQQTTLDGFAGSAATPAKRGRKPKIAGSSPASPSEKKAGGEDRG